MLAELFQYLLTSRRLRLSHAVASLHCSSSGRMGGTRCTAAALAVFATDFSTLLQPIGEVVSATDGACRKALSSVLYMGVTSSVTHVHCPPARSDPGCWSPALLLFILRLGCRASPQAAGRSRRLPHHRSAPPPAAGRPSSAPSAHRVQPQVHVHPATRHWEDSLHHQGPEMAGVWGWRLPM